MSHLSALLPDIFETDRQTIRFRPTSDIRFDTVAFEELTRPGGGVSIPKLAEAAALYRGDFLTGLALNDCPEFETWLLSEQEYWRQRLAEILDQIISHHLQRGEESQAQIYARRWLTLEPWREEAHRYLMILLAQSGQRSAALAQFETCRRLLAEELDVEPSAETMRLVEAVAIAMLIWALGTFWQANAPEVAKSGLGLVSGLLPLPQPYANGIGALLIAVGLSLLVAIIDGLYFEWFERLDDATSVSRLAIWRHLTVIIVVMLIPIVVITAISPASFWAALYWGIIGILHGLAAAMLLGLFYGGSNVIRHGLIRLMLRADDTMPWRYPQFLDYAAERILLRKVGGGYIFMHGLLQAHFANLATVPPWQSPTHKTRSETVGGEQQESASVV